MSNKLPKKYEESFFAKIKKIFSSIFGNKNITIDNEQVSQDKIAEMKPEKNVFDEMKDASNKEKLKEDILSLVKSNPDLIDTLPVERLKELNNICDARIEELDRNIKKLKREIA